MPFGNSNSENRVLCGKAPGFGNPKGIVSFSPGLRGTSYPGLGPRRLQPQRGNGAYLSPKTLGESLLRRLGPGMVSKSSVRLSCCISLSIFWRDFQLSIAALSHWYCSAERATLTVLALTLRVH